MNKKLLFVSISLLFSLLVINISITQVNNSGVEKIQLSDRNDDPGSGGTI